MRVELASALIGLLMIACTSDESAPPKFVLEIQSISENKAMLEWNEVAEATAYSVWRIHLRSNGVSQPTQIAFLDGSTLAFFDEFVPISNRVSYYVLAETSSGERQSNEVSIEGARHLFILPEQVELVSVSNSLALIKDYTSLWKVDYDLQVALGKRQFPGHIGTVALGGSADSREVYVPCSNGYLYICDAHSLECKDSVDTGTPLYGAAANAQGRIFLSTSNGATPIKVYSRATLGQIGVLGGDNDSELRITSDSNLVSINTHSFPPTIRYFELLSTGGSVSASEDPYFWEYPMDAVPFEVSDKYIVTSHNGAIYNADTEMLYVGKLSSGISDYTGFEFSSEGETIYSCISTQKNINKSVISDGTITTTSLITKGYPWMVALEDDTLLVISCYDPFPSNILTGQIFLEVIHL